MDFEEAVNKARRLAKKYSEKRGYRLNPDSDKVKDLIEEMVENLLEFGARYCPCMTKRLTGDKKADGKRICPCVWHKEDIAQFGESGLALHADLHRLVAFTAADGIRLPKTDLAAL